MVSLANDAAESCDVLIVGSGALLSSLAAALRKLGCSRLRAVAAASAPGPDGWAWSGSVRQAQWVLLASGKPDMAELRALEAACRQAGKPLLPAVVHGGIGLAGPLIRPEDADGGCESGWRRLHLAARGAGSFPGTGSPGSGRSRGAAAPPPAEAAEAAAMLAHVAAAAWRTEAAEGGRSALRDHLYLLDLDTAEGGFHPFQPHPASSGRRFVPRPLDAERLLEPGSGGAVAGDLPAVFDRLTSPVTGIFQCWDEADLEQLPLCQCRVRPADPLAEREDGWLPEIVCAGLTHLEARREAGLAGIEAYVARAAGAAELTEQPAEWAGIGAGGTAAEALNRALTSALVRLHEERTPPGRAVRIRLRSVGNIGDAHCRYYWQALTIDRGPPLVGEGERCLGFPTVWVGVGGDWYGGVGLNRTLAFRSALQRAILAAKPAECKVRPEPASGPEAPALAVPEADGTDDAGLARSALRTLRANRCRLFVFDLAAEPFLRDEWAGVLGVRLEEEGE